MNKSIELFGLPGSGKTYLAEKTAFETGIHNIQITNRNERFLYAIKFLILHPIIFHVFLIKIFQNYFSKKHPGLKHKLLYLYLNAVAKEAKCKKTFSIIDEGLYQFIFSLYEEEVPESTIKSILRLLEPLDREVWYVVTDDSQREDRIRDRKSFARDHFGVDYVSEFKNVCYSSHLKIKSLISTEMNHIKVVEN